MIITTRTPTSISAATNNAAKYTINNTPLTQVTKGLVMNCSRRGVKISFSILQRMYLKKGTTTKITLGNWSLNVEEVSRNQWKSILAREENPIVEGRKTLPPQKTPQRQTSRNPEKWLRQQPRAAACPGNVCTGRGGAEKRHLEEEEEGRRGWSSKTKSPSRLPSSWRSQTSEAAPNELIPPWAKWNPTLDTTLRVESGRQALPPRSAPHVPPTKVGMEPLWPAEPPLPAAPHQPQAGLAPSHRPHTIPPSTPSLTACPLPLPGAGGLNVCP